MTLLARKLISGSVLCPGLYSGLSLLALMAASSGASAATATKANTGIEEITVTANRRAQSSQKVGIAITAFSGTQLRQLGVTKTQDIAALTPGVSVTGAQGGFLQTFAIRGVSQNDFNPHQEGPVAVYIDDAYISSLQGQGFSTFDTQSIEIDKGPQGTLFGRNATGGLVNYRTNKPTNYWTGHFDVGYGSYNQRSVEGAVGGPISDTVSIRVAGIYSGHDPILQNGVGANYWNDKTYAGRVHLQWKPNDQFTALISARYGYDKTEIDGGEQFPSQVEVLRPNADGTATEVNARNIGTGTSAMYENEAGQAVFANGLTTDPLDPGAAPPMRPCGGCTFTGYRDGDGPGDFSDAYGPGHGVTATTNTDKNYDWSEAYGFTSNLQYQLNGVQLVSITDYSYFDWRSGADIIAGNATPAIGDYLGYDTAAPSINQLSQELRASGGNDKFRWIGGLYGLDIRGSFQEAYGYIGPNLDEQLNFSQHTQSIATFAQGEYAITPAIKFILGGRYTHDQKNFDFESQLYTTPDTAVGPPLIKFNSTVSPLANLDTDLYSYKVGLNWQAGPKTLVYATINRGTKSGGFNTVTVPNNTYFNAVPFAPEVLMAYELGTKYRTPDNRYGVEASGFYYDYQNYQALQSIGFTNFIVGARARTWGLEATGTARPTDQLTVQAGAAYTSNIVYNVALGENYVVNRVAPFTPKWKLTALVRYEIPTPLGDLGLQANGTYNSSYFFQLQNFQDTRNTDYALLDLRADFTFGAARHWSVAAFIKNVSDARFVVSGFDTSSIFGGGDVAYNMPRVFGLEAHYHF
jgi:iron complex outermembrane receptor protein